MAKKVLKRRVKKINVPKECYFCKEDKTPTFADPETLRRFLTERGKIMGAARNGLCARHQKKLTAAIKYARHLALLPFTSRY
ncbi:MAG: 30S ribosomal protein S18 [Candidatus Levybacteria bacterium]|nr:30S ribosomal protein S18 [Candidatus Levybacteria bacterium]